MCVSRFFKRFSACRRGNVAMMTTLVAVPLIALMGGAVDIMRMNQTKAEIQGAIDAGVLALSEIGNDNDPETTIRQFIEANLTGSRISVDDIDLDVTVTKYINYKEVEVDASYKLGTYFLGVMGMKDMPIGIRSAGLQSYRDVEIAVVLDISLSMDGDKFTNLKTAAEDFVNSILTDAVKDKTTISIIPFSTSVNVGDQYWEFVKKTDVDNNHDTKFSDGHYWRGCVELETDDFDDSKPGANSMFVLPTVYTFFGATMCPAENNQALFLSNTKSDLVSMIDGMSLSYSTGLDIGAAIGLKALSPAMKGHLKGDMHAKHPAAYDSGTLKVLIVMTDGEATAQDRPKDGCDTLNDIWVPTGMHSGYWKDCDETKYSAATARSNFTAVCNSARQKGIAVYTIGFQIKKGENSDQILEDCATTSSQYYYIEDTNIGSAFKSIAASINSVRLTL